MDGPGDTARRRSVRGGSAWIAVVLGAAACALWSGCSVEKHYRILSFFFDGVPDPNAPRPLDPTTVAGVGSLRDSPTYSVHPPFKEEKCGDCHVSRFRQEALEATVCLKCHERKTEEYPHMHGPVAAMACLWCHAPHESAFAHLLKAGTRDLCMRCHEAALLNVVRVPAHAETGRDCLECHSGHGGDRPFFLTPAASGALAAPGVRTEPAPGDPAGGG